jgi:hypothetical protein
MGSLVTLTPNDLGWAEDVGRRRLDSIIEYRRAHGSAQDRLGRDELSSHVQGACGELAFARWLNVPWSASVDTFKGEPDVAPDFEVKTVEKHEPKRPYYLKVPLIDSQMARVIARRYVLVVLDGARAWVLGWLPGKDALVKDDSGAYIYKRDPKKYAGHPALFVPDGRLLLWTKGMIARASAEAAGA